MSWRVFRAPPLRRCVGDTLGCCVADVDFVLSLSRCSAARLSEARCATVIGRVEETRVGGLLSGFNIRLYLRARRARQAAVAALAPLIEQSRRRCGPAVDAAWRQPYMIGFLSMLITLAAMSSTRRPLSRDELGLAQIESWSRLTRLPDDSIGEDIQLLSAERNGAFVEGCANALDFWSAYRLRERPYDVDSFPHRIAHMHAPDASPLEQISLHEKINYSSSDASDLWRFFFENRLKEG